MVHAGLELPPQTAFASQLIRAGPQPASAGSWWKCLVQWVSGHAGGKVYREVRICYSLDFRCQQPDVAARGDGLIYEGTLTTWLQPPTFVSDLRDVKRAGW